MREVKFRKWMQEQKRFYRGEWGFYSKFAVNSRISCLNQLEEYFNIDLDTKVVNLESAKEFLVDIRNAHIEDLAHTPLSNAFRHYYKFSTGTYIDKIF